MNLRNETDLSLMAKTETLVRQERELLSSVLHHLQEIQRRRLYSALGYKSLFDFTVRRLGYSEDQAYRRITAMKLMTEIPQVEEKINAGEISLTHIGLAQSLFRGKQKHGAKEFSSEQKLDVLEQISNKPVREAERITVSLSSAPAELKPDKIRPLADSRIEMKFTANEGLKVKIETLKGFLAHKNPNLSLGELFEQLCDLGIKTWDPAKTAAPKKRCATGSSEENIAVEKTKPSAAEIRRQVFQKAGSACQNCGSQFALEIDHVYPQALGGTSERSNLRVLCRSCNQRAAIEVFGQHKMSEHLN